MFTPATGQRREKATTAESLLLQGIKTLELETPREMPCRECGRQFTAHFEFQCVCDPCVQEYTRLTAEQYRAKVAQDRRFRLASMGLGDRFADATLDTFSRGWQPEAYDAAAYIIDGGKLRSLVLLGSPGTGKTHLACAILRGWVERGGSGRYVDVPLLSATLKLAANWQEAAARAVEPLYRVDLVVLDDCGREKPSPGFPELIDTIINRRWAKELPTILCANLSRVEMFGGMREGERVPGWLSSAAASRIGGTAHPITMQEGDYRLRGNGPLAVVRTERDPTVECPTCRGAGWVLDARVSVGRADRLMKCPSCDGAGF